MAALTIDLSNYKDKVGARVPEGRYKVIVEDAEQDTARSGNDMINLWFRIVEGDQKDSTVVDRLVLTEKSLFRVVGFMQALGMPTPKKRLQVNVKQFIGKPLEIDVEDGEPYMGRVKSEVRGYNRAAKGAASAVTELPEEGDFEAAAVEDAPADPWDVDAGVADAPAQVPDSETSSDDVDLSEIDL